MKKFLAVISIFVISCAPEKIPADLLVKNANIYTVNANFDTEKAFVVKDGRILEIGIKPELELKYDIAETYDAEGKTVVPGLIDGHAHLFGLGMGLQTVDLLDTKSYAEVLERVVAFQNEKNAAYIIGRGWDQNDWEVKEFPTKKELDSLFPDTPVSLRRIGGHAMIVNTKAIELAGITAKTKVAGGEVILKEGQLSGVLIDNAMKSVLKTFPKTDAQYISKALLDAEKICLELGLTTVNEAGLDRVVIDAIDSLQQSGAMSLRIYAMVADSKENLDYYLKAGILKTDRLNVRSVKVYGDGALGSRGAAMRKEYSDQPGQFGLMRTTEAQLDSLARVVAAAGFQMNTHAIGDSANVSVLRVYSKVLKDKKDPRWKVEHAQIVTPSDYGYFSEKIIPSVQPTHATSDMYWAEDRIGSERIKGAYAYKILLDKAGIIVLGTDFPVENVNPMYTFYAAVARKDLQNYPEGGYRKDEGLTREETLKGMTIWAAYSNFEENEKGSIEVGKFADFTVLDRDIMTIPEDSIPKTKVVATFINGKKVYSSSESE
jgi:predicted amidohydrolase YtcJ